MDNLHEESARFVKKSTEFISVIILTMVKCANLKEVHVPKFCGVDDCGTSYMSIHVHWMYIDIVQTSEWYNW